MLVALTLLICLATFCIVVSLKLWGSTRILVLTFPVLGAALLGMHLNITKWLAGSLMVVILGAISGFWISQLLKTKSSIVSFGFVAALTDFFSFSGGLTRNIIDTYKVGDGVLLEYLTVSFPWYGKTVFLMGIGDIVILSVLFTSLSRFYRLCTAFLFPVAGLVVGLLVGIWGGGIYAIPFICMTGLAPFLFERIYKQ